MTVSQIKNRFIYFMPVDNYFVRLMAEIIRANHLENSIYKPEQIIIPIYGERFDESTDSKYPQWLKRIHLISIYWKRQISLEHSLKQRLKPYLNHQQICSIKFAPAAHFFLASILDHIIYQSKSLFQLPNAKNIYSFNLSDQVIDTYLRFKPSAKYNPKDPFINDIWHRARALNYLIKFYTRNAKACPTVSISSYTTYTTEGIFCRQSVASGCTLVTLGDTLNYFKVHCTTRSLTPSQGEDHCLYTYDQAISLPYQIIQLAEKTLHDRTKGKYDDSMPYMPTRNMNMNGDLSKSITCKDKVVMFLHDFFDSPHHYDWMLFDDFWSWAYETIEFCIQQQISLVIKPHPNQLPESAEIVLQLQERFEYVPLIQWIPALTPNAAIFDQNPKLILSVYGSVAAEAAYCRQRILLAGDHPAINFKIGFTARTKSDYWSTLKYPETISIGNRRDAILFTALHYKNSLVKENDSLWTHEGIDFTVAEKNPEVLRTKSANNYISKMTKKLLKEVIQNQL